MHTLEITARDGAQKNTTVRSEGKIPAVFYGRKEESTAISVDKKEFIKVLREAGESTIITLKGGKHDVDALIKDVQKNPINDEIEHVDFYALEKGKLVTVYVPLTFDGVSPAVKELGGSLVKVMHEIEIEALPKDLIQSLTVDISTLVDFESQIQIKDIKLPNGVTALGEPDEVVALAEAPHDITEDESAEAVDISAIEVEKKGKKEEGETSTEA